MAIILIFAYPDQSKATLPTTLEQYREALDQPDFGMYFVDTSQGNRLPLRELKFSNLRQYIRKALGKRISNHGQIDTFGSLLIAYLSTTVERGLKNDGW